MTGANITTNGCISRSENTAQWPERLQVIGFELGGFKPLLDLLSEAVCSDEMHGSELAEALVLLGGMAQRLSFEMGCITEGDVLRQALCGNEPAKKLIHNREMHKRKPV